MIYKLNSLNSWVFYLLSFCLSLSTCMSFFPSWSFLSVSLSLSALSLFVSERRSCSAYGVLSLSNNFDSNAGMHLNSFLGSVMSPSSLGTGLESPLRGIHPILHHTAAKVTGLEVRKKDKKCEKQEKNN